MSKKTDNKIKVKFIGGSAEDVTGSAVLIDIPSREDRYYILIEFGGVQGGSLDQDFVNNKKMCERLNKDIIKKIKYVFVSHAHIDHTQNIPYLYANGYNGKVYALEKCVGILKHLIDDSVSIHTGTITKLKQKNGKKSAKPLYTKEDAELMKENIVGVSLYDKIQLTDELTICYREAGHILGSGMIDLTIVKPNNSKVKITYTGDMGSDHNNSFKPFIDLRDCLNQGNLLITEGTYNDLSKSFLQRDSSMERLKLKEDIFNDLKQGKQIIFSAFSFGRSQELMSMLYRFYAHRDDFDYNIYVDGVLVHKINEEYLNVLKGKEFELWQDIMNWDRIKHISSYESHKLVLTDPDPKVVISTSGFLSQGRIVSYLERHLSNKNAVLYISGYCGDDSSLGFRILNPTQKTITINKVVYAKKCEVKQLKTFTSHIQSDEILQDIKDSNFNKVLVHHSSGSEKFRFVENLKRIMPHRDIQAVVLNEVFEI